MPSLSDDDGEPLFVKTLDAKCRKKAVEAPKSPTTNYGSIPSEYNPGERSDARIDRSMDFGEADSDRHETPNQCTTEVDCSTQVGGRLQSESEWSVDTSLDMVENYYEPEQTTSNRRRERNSRSRLRRHISCPMVRTRSLSFGRKSSQTLAPNVASRPKPIQPRPVKEGVEEESEEEEEEWHYVPFSFWQLSRRNKMIFFSLGLVEMTLYMCLSILAPFFPTEAHSQEVFWGVSQRREVELLAREVECLVREVELLVREAASRGVSSTVSGWIFGCFSLTQFIFSPIFGYLVPQLGSRFMFLTGQFVAAGCTILFGVLDFMDDADSLMFVVFCFLVRVLLAIGCSATLTASWSIMVNTFPDNVATVFGLIETFCGVGLTIGPAVGGVLYQAGGFMLPFIFLGVIMMIAVPVTMCILPKQDDGDSMPIGTTSLLQLLCIPSVSLVCFAIVIGAIIWALLDPTLQPHLQVYNLSPSIMGLIFLLMSGFYAISSPFWGRLADRIEDSTPLLVLGFLASSVGVLLLGPSPVFSLPPGYRRLWLDVVALSVLGFSVSLAVVPTFEKILDAAEKAGIEDNLPMYSLVAGLWGGAYALGDFIGPSFGGLLVDVVGFDWTMTLTALPCVLTAILLFFLWIYEKRVGPTPCLIAVSTKKKTQPSNPTEQTPLLSSANQEIDSLPTSVQSSITSSTPTVRYNIPNVSQRDAMTGSTCIDSKPVSKYEPLTQSV